MQKALDAYLMIYNTKRPHQGRNMKGRTPLKTFLGEFLTTTGRSSKKAA